MNNDDDEEDEAAAAALEEILDKLRSDLESHRAILDKLRSDLESHQAILDSHQAILDNHEARIARLEQMFGRSHHHWTHTTTYYLTHPDSSKMDIYGARR